MRECQQCGNLIAGRSDKKFCSDKCRNNFNNNLNAIPTNLARKVNGILRKNRRILESVKGKTTVAHLKTEGFDFNYYTNQSKTKSGNVYVYCYEYGYLQLDKEIVLIVRNAYE